MNASQNANGLGQCCSCWCLGTETPDHQHLQYWLTTLNMIMFIYWPDHDIAIQILWDTHVLSEIFHVITCNWMRTSHTSLALYTCCLHAEFPMTKVKMVLDMHNVQCYIYIVNASSTQSLQIPWDLLMLDYLHTLGWLDLNIDSLFCFSFFSLIQR